MEDAGAPVADVDARRFERGQERVEEPQAVEAELLEGGAAVATLVRERGQHSRSGAGRFARQVTALEQGDARAVLRQVVAIEQPMVPPPMTMTSAISRRRPCVPPRCCRLREGRRRRRSRRGRCTSPLSATATIRRSTPSSFSRSGSSSPSTTSRGLPLTVDANRVLHRRRSSIQALAARSRRSLGAKRLAQGLHQLLGRGLEVLGFGDRRDDRDARSASLDHLFDVVQP